MGLKFALPNFFLMKKEALIQNLLVDIQSVSGYKYHVVFIDDFSRFTWI
jgi:hypothetical protein